jgi:hypothetical protein
MNTSISTLVVLIYGVGLATFGQRPFPFEEIKTFRCEFLDGEGRQVVDGKTADRRGDRFSDPLMVDNINYSLKSARLVGNAGGSDLSLLSNGPLAVTFVEQTPQGGVVVLTIFKHAGGFDVHHRAVMSRHLPFSAPVGSLSMTQYYGTCRGTP